MKTPHAKFTVLLLTALLCLTLFSGCKEASEPPLTLSFATEELLSGGNVREFIAEDSAHSVQLFFTAQEVLKNLTFSSLTYETGTLALDEALDSFPKLKSGSSYAPTVVFYGDMTSYCLSFTDSHGRQRHFEVYLSGKDGSPVLNEVTFE